MDMSDKDVKPKYKIHFDYLFAYKGTNGFLKKCDLARDGDFMGYKESGWFTTTTKVDNKYLKKMKPVLKKALELDEKKEVEIIKMSVEFLT